MALEDLAMFRSVPGSTVFYPCDAVSCERAVELAANTQGICFIRTSRPNTPVIYGNQEPFRAGQAKIVRQSAEDKVRSNLRSFHSWHLNRCEQAIIQEFFMSSDILECYLNFGGLHTNVD